MAMKFSTLMRSLDFEPSRSQWMDMLNQTTPNIHVFAQIWKVKIPMMFSHLYLCLTLGSVRKRIQSAVLP